MDHAELTRRLDALEAERLAIMPSPEEGRRGGDDRRFLRFLAVASGLHAHLTRAVLARLRDDRQRLVALRAIAEAQDGRTALLCREALVQEGGRELPTGFLRDVFAYGHDDIAFATWAIQALLLEQACAQASPVAPHGARAAVAWAARSFALEADCAIEDLRARAARNDIVAARVRLAAADLELPGERVHDDYLKDVMLALKGRFDRDSLKAAARRLMSLPGLDRQLWPIVEPHLKRLGYGWGARQAARIALAAAGRS